MTDTDDEIVYVPIVREATEPKPKRGKQTEPAVPAETEESA